MKATGNYLLLHEKDESLHKHFADLLGPIMQVRLRGRPCSTAAERVGEDLDFQWSKLGFFPAKVADLHHFNADPDPSFHFTADPDPAPVQSDGNLRPQVFRLSRAPF